MKKKNGSIFRGLLYVISIIAIIYFEVVIMRYQYNRAEEQEAFEELKAQVVEVQSQEVEEQIIQDESNGESELNKTEEEPEPEPELIILPEYQQLYEENNDLYGWITIEGTVIDYPVMHTPNEPNFYISRGWSKESSELGSIYVDGRCTRDSENLIIYGHNMMNGRMFGSLPEYLSGKEYYEAHKYIEFNSIYEHATYEIIAVSKAVIYYEEEPPEGEYLFYEHIELDSKEEFDAYIKNALENSYYETDSTAEYGNQLITLCTCDYWTQNARLIIVAKKIEE